MTYFVSDIHLGAGDERFARETERRFVAWLDYVATDAEAIFLVGDLFDYWFEYRRVVPKGFVRTLGKLAELTDRGVRVVFISGNHDRWVGDYLARECGVEVYTTAQIFELYGRKVFVAHGHDLKTERRFPRRLREAMLGSRVLRWLFARLVHPDRAVALGCWWSARAREKQPPEAFITEPLIRFARSYAATHCVEYFVFGHTHYPRDFRDGVLRVINLGGGAWYPSYATLDAQGEFSLITQDR